MEFAAPPPETKESNTTALILSALVHLLLIGALFFGVQWKSQAPSSVAVEVWRSAPAPVVRPEPVPEVKPEPKPVPKPIPKVEPALTIKPDIAIKEEKKPKKEEPKKPEPKKEEPRKPEPKKAEPKKEDAKRVEPDFKKELDKDLASNQKALDQQKAMQDQRARAAAEANQLAQLKAEQASESRGRGLDDWSNKVRNKIRNNIVVPPNVVGNPEAVFGITQLVSGDIIEVKLRKSSGNKTLDEAIERAILKSSPLPKSDRAELYQRVFELNVQPLKD